MAKIVVGPVGRISKGHVLDVAVKPFVEAMRFYDPLLYVRWNAHKLKGHGCWEIRRKPDFMSVVEAAAYDGNTLVRLEYAETEIANCIMDCAFLNYDQLRKLREMDTFRSDHWLHDMEYREKKAQEEQKAKAVSALNYGIKQYRSEFRDYKEFVNSGNDPARLLGHWDDQKGSK